MEENKVVTPDARAEVVKNGPLRVFGNIMITHADGTEQLKEKVMGFCRCGLSANKPFCDGAHKRADWKDDE